MYTIELGKTSKTEIFFYLFLYIRALGDLAAQGLRGCLCTSLEPFGGAVQGAETGTQSGTVYCHRSCLGAQTGTENGTIFAHRS